MTKLAPEKILKKLGIDYFPKGNRLQFCCVLHDDRDPSAAAYQDTGLFHCFSCDYTLDGINFYARVTEQKRADAIRDLERDFGPLEERTHRCNLHLLNTHRNRGEKKLEEARILSRKDHALLSEDLDHILLLYERGRLSELELDKASGIWYNNVRESLNVGSYQTRIPKAGLDGGFEEGLGNLPGFGHETDGLHLASDGAEDSFDMA